MKQYILIPLLLLSFASSAQKHTLSGYVKDLSTGEFVIGAGVYLPEAETGARANTYGFYSITLPTGVYTVIVNFPGYNVYTDTVDLSEDQRLNIELTPKNYELETFEISADAEQNTKSTDMGRIKLNIDQVKILPAFMGEVDILKTVAFLPGVQSAGEGNSGFYVRGGGPDQNLILLDEAVVYNASHLFGFFSVFNADAVKGMEIIKGGMPANYGGRLASVLDISMRDGNNHELKGSGGIGLISSRLTLEGPIKKDTSSFIISGRRTYIDVLAEPFIPDTSAFKGSGYYFFDLNAKVNYRFSDKDRLYLSGYFGRDVFTYKNTDAGFNVRIPWGNATASLRWNHLFSDKLFMNTTAIFSDYNFAFEATQSQFTFKLLSGIQDYNFKTDFIYYPNPRHNIKFGGNYVYHIFTPSSVSAQSEDVEFDLGGIVKMYAHEAAIYVLDDFTVSERLQINLGYRHSLFQHVGPFTRYIKDDVGSTTEEVEYGRLEPIQLYHGPEPRVSMRYSITDSLSFKAAVAHNYQYVHLASISAVSLPTDVWFPSSDIVKPQINTQYSVGLFRNFKRNRYEASIELYYKDMNNLIEYAEGASPDDNVKDNVDNNLVFGSGYSYGAELFIKKRLGQFTGWIGYTYSRTTRQFPEINFGEEFPAKYDRRHDLSVVATYELNDRWTFGGAFVYATGNAITLPVGWYQYEGDIQYEYGPRNSLRMSAYHRADISATRSGKDFKTHTDPTSGEEIKTKKRFVSSWSFSVYNLYNRANPYFIYIDQEGDFQDGTLTVAGKQVSLFPILPSATWNFKF